MIPRRLRAVLGLLLFLGGPVGTPILDGLLFHREAAAQVPHIEAADSDCHGERCVLGAHAIPALLTVPAVAPAAVPILRAANDPPPAQSHTPARRCDPATAPRAPPHSA